MKDLYGKQKAEYLLDASFVICSCANQPPVGLDKMDTECFEYYRVLSATDDNNGVFGKDSPIIRDIDCVPHINMDNFTYCQSDNYLMAMQDIISNLDKSIKLYAPGSNQYTILQDKKRYFMECIVFAIEQKNLPREARNYPCVLELLDSWFNVDDKTLISNKMNIITNMKVLQTTYINQINETVSKLRVGSYQYQKEEGLAPNILLLDSAKVDNKEVKTGVTLPKEHTNPDPLYFSEYLKDEKKRKEEEDNQRKILREELAVRDAMIKRVNECLKSCIRWKDTDVPVYKADEDNDTGEVYMDDIDIILSETENLKNVAYQALNSIVGFSAIAQKFRITKEKEELEKVIQEIFNKYSNLFVEISGLRKEIYERAAVTEDSFLVCRCGGIIKVVQNGSWVSVSKDRVIPNIVDLLMFAEKQVYNQPILFIDKERKLSRIRAFNIIHGLLLNAAGLEKTEYDYLPDEECEKKRKPIPRVEIRIEPASDALKQAKRVNAGKNALTLLTGKLEGIAIGASLIISTNDLWESGPGFTKEDFNSVESIFNVAFNLSHRLIKNENMKYIDLIKRIGKVLNNYSAIATSFAILQDLAYDSYAYFTGEIKIKVITFFEEYYFIGVYDIYGEKNGEYKYNCYKKQSIDLNPEENYKATINYKIYEHGVFNEGEEKISRVDLFNSQ